MEGAACLPLLSFLAVSMVTELAHITDANQTTQCMEAALVCSHASLLPLPIPSRLKPPLLRSIPPCGSSSRNDAVLGCNYSNPLQARL